MGFRTGQKNIPWLWIIWLGFPAAMSAFIEKCSGTALTFTIKKFTDDPVTIASLGSLNILFGITIAPAIAYYSDHHLGRWGRRKPFMLAGLTVLAVSLVFIPFASSLWLLVVLIIIYQASLDLGFTGLWDPLYADIVPNHQRGRGMVVNRYMAMAARLLFMFFLIGQFKEHVGQGRLFQSLAGKSLAHLTGEQLIYFIAAAGVLATVFLIGFGIREVSNAASAANIPFNLKRYLSSVFYSSEHRRLCLLVAASVLMTFKLGSLLPLLFTEQFQFSMQTMGQVHGITMMINALIVLPIAAILSDRIDRFKLFAVCLIGSTLQPILFWSYVHWVSIPTPGLAIGFHAADAALDHLGLIALWPLLYENSLSEDRGAMKAGFLIVGGIASFILANLLGFWVKWFSHQSPEGVSYDYMSGYLLIFIAGIAACILSYYGRPQKQNNCH